MNKIQKLFVVSAFSLICMNLAQAEDSYLATAEIPKDIIAKFDKDGDGKLTGNELKKFEKKIIEKGFDKDSDGKINEAEYQAYLALMKAKAEKAGKEKVE